MVLADIMLWLKIAAEQNISSRPWRRLYIIVDVSTNIWRNLSYRIMQSIKNNILPNIRPNHIICIESNMLCCSITMCRFKTFWSFKHNYHNLKVYVYPVHVDGS